jgi:hypothetical protein
MPAERNSQTETISFVAEGSNSTTHFLQSSGNCLIDYSNLNPIADTFSKLLSMCWSSAKWNCIRQWGLLNFSVWLPRERQSALLSSGRWFNGFVSYCKIPLTGCIPLVKINWPEKKNSTGDSLFSVTARSSATQEIPCHAIKPEDSSEFV